MYKSYSEQYLIQLMINSRFVAYNINSINNGNTSECSTVKSNSTDLIDATFCFQHECYIFKQVKNSTIIKILNKLKESNVYLIDATIDITTHKENFSNEQEEIFNFCSYYINEILNNQFVKSTITSIAAYLIRRYYCPKNYFYPKNLTFNNSKEKSSRLYNRIVNFLYTYKADDFILKERINKLIEQIRENKNENYQIQDFQESDFIVLRNINSNENFV